MIKITNGYLEMIGSNSLFQELAKKPFTAKTSYWLARVFSQLQKEGEIYFAEKQKLIEKHAKRYDAAGKKANGNGRKGIWFQMAKVFP